MTNSTPTSQALREEIRDIFYNAQESGGRQTEVSEMMKIIDRERKKAVEQALTRLDALDDPTYDAWFPPAAKQVMSEMFPDSHE